MRREPPWERARGFKRVGVRSQALSHALAQPGASAVWLRGCGRAANGNHTAALRAIDGRLCLAGR